MALARGLAPLRTMQKDEVCDDDVVECRVLDELANMAQAIASVKVADMRAKGLLSSREQWEAMGRELERHTIELMGSMALDVLKKETGALRAPSALTLHDIKSKIPGLVVKRLMELTLENKIPNFWDPSAASSGREVELPAWVMLLHPHHPDQAARAARRFIERQDEKSVPHSDWPPEFHQRRMKRMRENEESKRAYEEYVAKKVDKHGAVGDGPSNTE